MTHHRNGIGLLIIGLFTLTAAFVQAEIGQAPHLVGKITVMDHTDLSLARRVEEAHTAHTRSGGPDFYFTGYLFMSRHAFNLGHDDDSDTPFQFTIKNQKIHLKRPETTSGSSLRDTAEQSGQPSGIVSLHDKSGKILDVHLIDLDESYEFESWPMYWLGSADSGESADYLRRLYRTAEEKLGETVIFLISAHDSPSAYDFLVETASDSQAVKEHRSTAVFWLGNYRNERSLEDLKRIFRKTADPDLKEKIIFAVQLSDSEAALNELVRIAKTETAPEVRKQAIFWLGQKASEESVKALKGFVDRSDEDIEVRESAVFAISRLPEDQAVPLLLDIARTNANPQVRKQALFWLGRVDDERALELFEEILIKK